MCPCPASTTAGRSVPACSRQRRGRRRGGAGRAGPTRPRGHCVGERVRRATVEQDQRREGAAAVAARRRSRRRAGEQEKLTRARASGGDGNEVSVLGSAEEVAEGCCRRRGHARAAPVRGGLGWG
jgi:hypothetical protein